MGLKPIIASQAKSSQTLCLEYHKIVTSFNLFGLLCNFVRRNLEWSQQFCCTLCSRSIIYDLQNPIVLSNLAIPPEALRYCPNVKLRYCKQVYWLVVLFLIVDQIGIYFELPLFQAVFCIVRYCYQQIAQKVDRVNNFLTQVEALDLC